MTDETPIKDGEEATTPETPVETPVETTPEA